MIKTLITTLFTLFLVNAAYAFSCVSLDETCGRAFNCWMAGSQASQACQEGIKPDYSVNFYENICWSKGEEILAKHSELEILAKHSGFSFMMTEQEIKKSYHGSDGCLCDNVGTVALNEELGVEGCYQVWTSNLGYLPFNQIGKTWGQ
jgi:hypothetical protein